MCAIPNANYLEYMEGNDVLWTASHVPVNGACRPPEMPGHGAAFKPELLKSNRIGGGEVVG